MIPHPICAKCANKLRLTYDQTQCVLHKIYAGDHDQVDQMPSALRKHGTNEHGLGTHLVAGEKEEEVGREHAGLGKGFHNLRRADQRIICARKELMYCQEGAS